jgi:uncharacterized protein YjbJ (UPF0337 family)
MNRDEIQGMAKDLKGRLKRAGGVIAGNGRLENEGADEQDLGRAQQDVGRARRKLGRAVERLGRKIKR